MAVSNARDNHSVFEKLSSQGDVDGLIEMYDDRATYVASPDQVLEGHAEIRTALQAMVDMGYETRLELVGLVESGDVALEKSRWTTRIKAEDGTTTESSGLSTVVLKRHPDGCWRIVIDDPGLS